MRAAVATLALALAACAGPPTVGTAASELVTTLPGTVDFGSVQLGVVAPPRTVTVLPQGLQASSDLISSITEACNDFTLDLTMLENPPVVERVCEGGGNNGAFFAPPGPCENHAQVFQVGFAPTVVGPQSCVVTIAMFSGQLKTLTVTGLGTAPPVALTLVSPVTPTIDFGQVVVTTTSTPVPVRLRGDGTEPATYTATVSPPVFAVSGQTSGSLAGGSEATFAVTCAPTMTAPVSGQVTITSNDPDQPTITLALMCEGIVSSLSITPSPVRFSPAVVGGASELEVVLVNTGATPLIVSSVAIEPEGVFVAGAITHAMLSPGVDASIMLEFHPTAEMIDTDVVGSLTVTYGPPAGQVRTIGIVGPVGRTELSVTPGDDLDFGVVCAGTSASKSLEIVNLGTRFSRLNQLDVSGAGFSLEYQGSVPFTLEAAAATSFEVAVVATPTRGEAVGELTLGTDAGDGVPVVRALRAVGLAAGIGADPAVVAFDGTAVGAASGVQQVRITNCDAAPIEIVSQGISGPNAAEFFVTGTPIDLTLALGETATWLVELRPSTAGEKVAALDLVHAGGVISVPLTGVGDGPLEGGGRGSYYACSTGGGGGSLWLLALALAPLARPRRRTGRDAGSRA